MKSLSNLIDSVINDKLSPEISKRFCGIADFKVIAHASGKSVNNIIQFLFTEPETLFDHESSSGRVKNGARNLKHAFEFSF